MHKLKNEKFDGVKLTCKQEDCVKTALEGHNFSMFGEAGTGKSRVVSGICKRKGKAVRVVCSMGIACGLFKEDNNLVWNCTRILYILLLTRLAATQESGKGYWKQKALCGTTNALWGARGFRIISWWQPSLSRPKIYFFFLRNVVVMSSLTNLQLGKMK